MKKSLLLLATAALGFTAQARELTFWLGDEKIEPGSSIEFVDPELTNFGSEDAPLYQLKYAPELYISDDIYTSKLSVTATCTSGQTIQMCCGGQCMNGTTVEKKNLKVQANEKLPLEFDYVEMPWMGPEYPVVVATIEAQDGVYTDTHISFTITMSNNKLSIDAVETNAPVRVTSTGIEYNLPAGSQIELFSITGSSVLKASVEGTGTIDTTSLKRGVYVYSVASPKVSRTGKIMVK